MSEQSSNYQQQEEADRILNHPSNPLKHTISPEDEHHAAYLSAKTKGLMTGYEAGLAALAEDNHSQRQRLGDAESKLRQDEKSGLATESHWKQELNHAITNLRPGQQLTVMIGDLNGFKAVNDSLGHAAGDELLRIVGQALSQSFRRDSDHLARGDRDGSTTGSTSGSIARLGGDEFSIFSVSSPEANINMHKRVPHNIDEVVKEHSERINKHLQDLTTGTKFEEFNITMALGGAEYTPTVDNGPDDVFVRADAEMYKVKYRGKIEKITPEDTDRLRVIIPYLQKLGTRIEPWLEEAIE